jgi:hypothetical protein
MQDTYSEYTFKLTASEKRIDKVYKFIDSTLKSSAENHARMLKLKHEMETEIAAEEKKKETMLKSMRIR